MRINLIIKLFKKIIIWVSFNIISFLHFLWFITYCNISYVISSVWSPIVSWLISEYLFNVIIILFIVLYTSNELYTLLTIKPPRWELFPNFLYSVIYTYLVRYQDNFTWISLFELLYDSCSRYKKRVSFLIAIVWKIYHSHLTSISWEPFFNSVEIVF